MDQLGDRMFLTGLPEDIRKYSRRKLYIRVGILFTVYLLELVFLILFWDSFTSVDINYKIVNSTAMLLLPPLVIIRPLKGDKSWVGRIHGSESGEKTVYEAKGSSRNLSILGSSRCGRSQEMGTAKKAWNLNYGSLRWFSPHSENKIELTLINGDDVFTKNISALELRKGRGIEHYPKGGTAVHIFGTKYTTVLHENEDDNIICVICGEENDPSDDHCTECGHSLLKKSNIR